MAAGTNIALPAAATSKPRMTPFSYEVMRGNTPDKTTLADILKNMQRNLDDPDSKNH